jgi:uncharacterized sulfatase
MREVFSKYLAEVTYYDSQVGDVLALLDKHKVANDTLVMVVSEQGNSFPFAKWTCYGHGLQSAMLVRWPGHVKPGSQTDAMVEYTDVTPTFVDVAGGMPDSSLDGKSFLKVMLGEIDEHKAFSFGEMTTRGIINGSDAFGIRTVRGQRYRLIWNLNHETKFTNACTKADYFQSMVAAGAAGDAHAKSVVDRYHYRPEFELYDCDVDPLEMKNLASDPEYAQVVERLKEELDDWMSSQGDLGIETELDAILHQGKYKNMTREDAFEAWKNKSKGKNRGDRKKKGKKKTNAQ